MESGPAESPRFARQTDSPANNPLNQGIAQGGILEIFI
jgi:hypothetical protein